MKNTIKIFAFIAFVLFSYSASAQSKALKIGHIATNELMELMPEVKQAQEKLNAKAAEFDKDFSELDGQRLALIKEYQDNEKIYTELKKQDKMSEIQNVIERMERFEQVAGEQLNTLRDELFRPIWEKINKAIQDVGTENGFTYILDATVLHYVSPSSENVLPLVKKKLGIV